MNILSAPGRPVCLITKGYSASTKQQLRTVLAEATRNVSFLDRIGKHLNDAIPIGALRTDAALGSIGSRLHGIHQPSGRCDGPPHRSRTARGPAPLAQPPAGRSSGPPTRSCVGTGQTRHKAPSESHCPALDCSPAATADQDARLGILIAPHRSQLDTRSGHPLDFKWFDRRLANSESERIGVGSTGRPPLKL